MAGKLEIVVKDNGNGIPQNIIDRIFQPFLTTKPVGQGSGLGLSLSYDIIKAHGGHIKLDSKDGEESAFIIILPLVSTIKNKRSVAPTNMVAMNFSWLAKK